MKSLKLTPLAGIKGCQTLNEIQLFDLSGKTICILGRNETTFTPESQVIVDPSAQFLNCLSRKHLTVELRNGHVYARALCHDFRMIRINSIPMTDTEEKEIHVGDVITLLGTENIFCYVVVDAGDSQQWVDPDTASRASSEDKNNANIEEKNIEEEEEEEEEEEVSGELSLVVPISPTPTTAQALLNDTVNMEMEIDMEVNENVQHEEQRQVNKDAGDDFEGDSQDDEDISDDGVDEVRKDTDIVPVDLSVAATTKYSGMPPIVRTAHIINLLCQKNKRPQSSIFHYSKLYQHLPLPFLSILKKAPPSPPMQRSDDPSVSSSSSTQESCFTGARAQKSVALPVPLSTSELHRISQACLHGQQYVDASHLTGKPSACALTNSSGENNYCVHTHFHHVALR